MDTTYAYVYFNESKDPEVKKLFLKKMKPFGEKAFTEPDVGMKRVRDEFYAFSAEVNAAYLLIKETFTPQDVCKVHELEAIKLPPFSIPMLKGSKYRELFRQRLIWQQEVGINRRYNLMWISQKPTCESGTATFTSVGLTELRYAYIFMVVGFGVAFTLLAWEITWNKQRKYYLGIEDRSDPIHDLFAKANYPFIKALMYDLNFTLNMLQVDSGGWKINGTFTGIMGKFQKRSIELGILGALMRSDRMEVVDYTIVTMIVKSSIIFKQPPLSLVSNIYELPFSTGVWFSCGGFVVFYWITLVLFRLITKTEPFTVQESLYYMIGTICQQNVELMPHFNSAKLMFFFAHLTSFFIFTSYSASIVALLQSPSRAITTVADLAASPFKAGSMDAIYAFVYFNESKDPAVKELFQKKMKPLGKKAFTEADVGMRRVRDEFYAFSVEVNAAYLLIKETFTPQDVCKVYELEAIKLPPFSIPVLKGSKYRELLRQRLIWQREVGIIRRYNLIWIAQKPTCESGAAAFNSVGLNELRYVCIFMIIGFGVAFLLLACEIAWKKQQNKRISKAKLKQQQSRSTLISFLN
ncbi:ionotropic glutamate receptor-invertebrate [Culex quinquefasciatus]|uniref:Ionotropic glutamate receptor-invertebrate n=1 Tax=Culex quinquefasciatus TaxID=7176 RepID=B0WVH8_CULQU|nr:ionotropic glutamate receptor-invertebrate [Culex quinquefasciatus]|eukprot:XP_001861400.1 ionotropic glutamate receptor-invertebrate [Culex quinquefasciatus]